VQTAEVKNYEQKKAATSAKLIKTVYAWKGFK